MLNKEQAQEIVEFKINEPNPNRPEKTRMIVLEECTIEKDWGWIFFYQSSEYLETGNPSSQLVGNAPYLVNRNTGQLHETGTAFPIEHYIDEYEKTLCP